MVHDYTQSVIITGRLLITIYSIFYLFYFQFYGLFKQATLGVNTTPKPGFWDPTARAKW